MTSSLRASSTTTPSATGTFRGAGGLELFRQVWRPTGQSQRVLINVHGLGDHSGLYPYLVDHFVRRGFTIHSFDLRGNGRSPGQRAYISSWDEFREDLARFVDVVRAEEGDQPLFLAGTSLGGLIVVDYALSRPDRLSGVVAASAPLGRLGVPGYLLALGRVASVVLPRLSMQTGMDLTGLARDPAIAEHVLNDPLFHRLGTARLGTEIQRTIARVRHDAGRFRVPLLLLHGSADRMVPPDGSREFIGMVGGQDKMYREYPGGYHVLFADVEREQVLDDVEQWMIQRG